MLQFINLKNRESYIMYTATTKESQFSIKDFEKVAELLKPKQITYTSSKEVYDSLIKEPGMNEQCLKLSNIVDGTYNVDVAKLNEINNKPFMITDWL